MINTNECSARGFKIAEIFHSSTILHNGWEMDNEAWLVRLTDGTVTVLTTSHGGVYEMKLTELQEKIAETEDSLKSLYVLNSRWPEEVK